MSSLLYYKIFASILIGLTSLIAVIYPLKIHARAEHHPLLELGDAFASGIFLGAALFHMLPNAIAGFSSANYFNHYPIAELFCASGFLLLLFFERAAQSIPNKKNLLYLMPYTAAGMLIIHSLIEGSALGINASFGTALVIFLAIIVHKGSESFALAVILNRGGISLKKMIVIISIFSLMTPLGIGLGASLSSLLQSQMTLLLTAGFNAFAAGTFLYMSTLHHINHHQRLHEKENLKEFIFLCLGLVLMALLAKWV